MIVLAAPPGRRLIVNGSNLTTRDQPDKRITLVGFNFDYMVGKLGMDAVSPLDKNITNMLPGANMARLVMVHWLDEPAQKAGHDCYAPHPPYLTNECITQFDAVLQWATQEAGLWATVTLRGSLAAGDGGQGRTVFTNATLRAELIDMWGFLANRYRSLDGVAGFEVMSEPRWDGSDAVVHLFQKDACAAVWAADADAICFIGPATFYDRYSLGEQWLLPGNVVYAANFFEPKQWVTADAGVASVAYPGGVARCCDLASHRSCSGGCHGANVTFDRAWLAQLLEPAVTFQRKYDVPVWIDQWGLYRNAGPADADRARYWRDMLDLLGAHDLHFAVWIWRRPTCAWEGYPIVCPRDDGSVYVYETAVAELARWLHLRFE